VHDTTMKASTRKKIEHFIDHPVTDVVVVVLIVVSIVLLMAELAVTSEQAKTQLGLVNDTIIFVFIAELSLRWMAETKKRRFFRHYWVDILAVVPYLRMLRILRVFRLLRVFKFGLKASKKMGWLNSSLQREAVQWFAMVTFVFVVVLFGGVGIRLSEGSHLPLSEALWWSVMSMVAGEPMGSVPISTLGRVVALGVMVSGLTVFAMLTGVISAMMVHRLGHIDTRAMDIDELSEHILICGWNRSGPSLVDELQRSAETKDRAIVIIGEFEQEPEWPASLPRPNTVYILKGDCTRLDVLQKAGLERATHAIVLADLLKERSDQDRDARTVLTAMLIERMKREIFTSVELLNRENESFLKMTGVDEIVVGTEYAASIIATATKTRGMVKVLDELLTARYGNQFYKTPVAASMVGRRVGDIHGELKRSHDVVLIGIQHNEKGSVRDVEVNPPFDRIVTHHDILLLIGRHPVDLSRE